MVTCYASGRWRNEITVWYKRSCNTCYQQHLSMSCNSQKNLNERKGMGLRFKFIYILKNTPFID